MKRLTLLGASLAIVFAGCDTLVGPEIYEVRLDTVGSGTVSPEEVQEVEEGEEIEVIASPEQGWIFSQWEGDVSGGENPRTITVNEDLEITAVFTRQEYALT